jgi:hypothetical protein
MLLRKLFKTRSFSIRIDCKKDLSNINGFVDNLEKEVGFYPTFSTLNSIINYIEAFLPLKKHNLPSNVNLQLEKVLNSLGNSLKLISTSYPRDNRVKYNYSVVLFDEFQE